MTTDVKVTSTIGVSLSRYSYKLISKEVNGISKYYDEFVQYKPILHDDLFLYNNIQHPNKKISKDLQKNLNQKNRRLVLLNANVNHHVHAALEQ